MPSYIKEKYNDYEIGSKIKTGLSYIYNFSKPVVQYTSNKMAEGAKYLYNKISGNNNSEENTINMISLERDDEVQKSSLIFEKGNDDNEEEEEKEEKEEQEEKEDNKNIEIQEFPSLSTINIVSDNIKNQNIDSSDNAAPIEIKLSTSDEKNEE